MIFLPSSPLADAREGIWGETSHLSLAGKIQYAAGVVGKAALIAGSAGLLRVVLIPVTGNSAPYLVFFAAVLLASTSVGAACGVVTTVFSGALAAAIFSPHAGATSLQLLAQFALFFCEAGSAAMLAGGFFRWRLTAKANLAALGASEERYQLALRATSDLLRDYLVETDDMTFGDGLAATWGHEQADRKTNRAWWLAHIHPDDQPRIEASLAEAANCRRELWEAEYRFGRADGTYRDVLDKAFLIYRDDGQFIRLIAAMQDVTQRRKEQREVRAAESMLRLITDALPAVVCYLDEQGRHQFVNAEWERWFKEPRENLIGKTREQWAGTKHRLGGDYHDSLAAAMQGQTKSIERIIYKPGEPEMPVTCTFVPDIDEHNNVRGVVCLISDITEQKRNERSLRESEEHYRVLAEVVPQVIFEARTDGKVAYANSRWARYTGLLPEHLLDNGWLQAVHPNHQRRVLAGWQDAVAGRHEYETELLLYSAADNVWRWHMLRALALTDDTGQARRWLGCLVDIHERKKAEQELQKLANYIPQLAWVADVRGEVHWLNKRWYDYTGKTLQELSGLSWLDCISSEHQARVRLELKEAFRLQRPFEGTFLLNSQDGEQRWFLTRAIPISDDSGKTSRWFGTSTDIHDQREAQHRLVQAQSQLQTAVRARDEFMSIASHELKTPLTSLQLVAQMAHRNLMRHPARACEPERVRKLIVQTEKSVQRLTRLVDDMLDSSRIAVGKLSFKFEDFDLAELVQEVVEHIMPQIEANGSRITVHKEGQALGRWDRFRIEQVLLNLLTNAIRYGAGSAIEVGVHKSGDRASFSIRDHGPGIALHHQGRIFEQFERATPHSSISGLGLGLFICREIVQRHGGQISLASTPGDGAAFEVNLPCRSDEAKQAPQAV